MLGPPQIIGPAIRREEPAIVHPGNCDGPIRHHRRRPDPRRRFYSGHDVGPALEANNGLLRVRRTRLLDNFGAAHSSTGGALTVTRSAVTSMPWAILESSWL